VKKFKHQMLPLIGIANLFALLGPSLVILNTPNQEVPLDVWVYLIAIFLGILLIILLIFLLIKQWIKFEFLTILIKSIFLALFFKIIYDYSGISGIIGPNDGAPKVNGFSLRVQIESTLAFLVLWVFSFILFRRFSQIADQFFIAAILISTLMPVYIFASYQYIQDGNNNQNYKFNYSSQKNIIIIYADMLQGSTSRNFFKENPAVFNQLEGFTIYPNAVSPFPFTSYSLPAFLSGKIYARSQKDDFKDNLQYAQEDSFITDAINKGFDPQIVGLKNLKLYSKQKNLYNGFSGAHLSQSLVRATIKRIFKLNLQFESKTENEQMIGLKKLSLEVMNAMKSGNLIDSKPIITMVHNFIPHTPIYFPNSNKEDNTEKSFNPNNYYEELNFFYINLNQLFDKLKEIGVYDNSLIMVFGDHGHFISREMSLYKFPLKKNETPGYETGPWERTIGMYNPLIMIKPPLSSPKPIISNSGISITNIREIINKFIGGDEHVLDKYTNQIQEIIVFKDAKKSPYLYTQDHKIIKFNGNINDLLYKYTTPLNIDQYKFGDILSPVNNYLFGKWVKEKNGAWLQEQRARATFKIKDFLKSQNIFLSLKVTPLISSSYPYQDLELLVNGKSIGIHRFNRSEQEVKIPIPKNIYKDDENIFRLEFIPINPISPKAIGLWDESYLLSVYVHSLSLSEY